MERDKRDASMLAVKRGMKVVRRFQQEGLNPADTEVKPDDTIVTACDRRSQAVIFGALAEQFPGAVLIGEEKTAGSGLNIQPDLGQDGWLVDPLDGTSAFAQGLPTSTVVVAYRQDHRITGCTIGLPANGQVWYSWGEEVRLEAFIDPFSQQRTCRVWDGALAPRKSAVYLDVSHAWPAAGITDRHQASLREALGLGTNVLMPGSNALMQALVANGGQRVAGSITTAKGGPWDLAGVKLVLDAGGHAHGCRRGDSGSGWEETDPLNVDETQVLICANSQANLAILVRLFEEATTD